MSRNRATAGFLLATLVLLLLTACSSETTVTFYEQEEWEVENVSQVNLSSLPEVGVGGELIPELGLGLDIAVDTSALGEETLKTTLNQLMGYYRSHGIDASWDSRSALGGDTVYTIQLAGTGLDTLRTVVFTGTQATVRQMPNDRVEFSLPLPEELGLGSMLFMDFTFHVKGAEIVRSNAREVSRGEATWQGSLLTSSLNATVVPKKRLGAAFDGPTLVIVGIAVLFVLSIGGAIGVVLLRRRAVPSRARRPSRRPTSRSRRSSRRRSSRRRR